jgi:transcription elongation factor Elf1
MPWKKPQGLKKSQRLGTTFTGRFGDHGQAIQVRLENRAEVGQLQCKVCRQRFQKRRPPFSVAVDVSCFWTGARERLHWEAAGQASHNLGQCHAALRPTVSSVDSEWGVAADEAAQVEATASPRLLSLEQVALDRQRYEELLRGEDWAKMRLIRMFHSSYRLRSRQEGHFDQDLTLPWTLYRPLMLPVWRKFSFRKQEYGKYAPQFNLRRAP